MMPRYVDIDVAEDYLLEGYLLEETYNMIPADVEEVRHGEWIKQHVSQELCGVEYYCCSLCNREEQYKPPYCPHCGAKMDEKERSNGKA